MIDAEIPVPLAAIELEAADEPIDLGADVRAAVEARWRLTVAANPTLWNGPFFLFDRVRLDGTVLRARALRTDFAHFLHWRAAAVPDPRFAHLFPVAAVTTADDRLMLGEMAATTANPGKVYPPSGSFDPADLIDGRLDPRANMVRELAEEAGLALDGFAEDAGYVAIASGPRRLALVRRFRSPAVSAALATRAARGLAEDPEGELARIRFVDFDEPLAEARTVPYVPRLLARLAAERDGARAGTDRRPERPSVSGASS